MEINEDIVIVGAGIAGLATALGLHRLGLRSLVLESSDGLRITGFALITWNNAWKALEALGIADSIRRRHLPLDGIRVSSAVTGLPISEKSFERKGQDENYETQCVIRKILLETLKEELPHGTIKYSSKVVSIEERGCFKIVHLGDGSSIKTKVLIGCDGVNSVVAKWLGLKKAVDAGRSAIRALVEFPEGHGFERKFLQCIGHGVRYGYMPCNEKTMYWFFTFTSLDQKTEDDMEDNPAKMKQFVLSKLGKLSQQVQSVVERTELVNISCASLKLRWPWDLLRGEICRGNVCVAGDALHPMTPDIGQGGCSALEDGVVLARCLGDAFLAKTQNGDEWGRIEKAVEKYGKERRWRSIGLIATAYTVGMVQQSDGKVMSFLRDNLLPGILAGSLLKMADFDCGKLN